MIIVHTMEFVQLYLYWLFAPLGLKSRCQFTSTQTYQIDLNFSRDLKGKKKKSLRKQHATSEPCSGRETFQLELTKLGQGVLVAGGGGVAC